MTNDVIKDACAGYLSSNIFFSAIPLEGLPPETTEDRVILKHEREGVFDCTGDAISVDSTTTDADIGGPYAEVGTLSPSAKKWVQGNAKVGAICVKSKSLRNRCRSEDDTPTAHAENIPRTLSKKKWLRAKQQKKGSCRIAEPPPPLLEKKGNLT